ncbi:MAG: hypothetical protein IPL46_02530 [Saprospiraceae bacterium]|nr:hypothetical protein [Saprospiraceae bacterium]
MRNYIIEFAHGKEGVENGCYILHLVRHSKHEVIRPRASVVANAAPPSNCDLILSGFTGAPQSTA